MSPVSVGLTRPRRERTPALCTAGDTRPPGRVSPGNSFARRGRQGFALLITITLLAFLVLLLVSLASLTRVETQVADNSLRLQKARQNALMALNLAMGELQRTAGPDKRVTANAELLASSDATKAKWTGVWDAASTVSAPEWLVSGTAAQRVNTGAMAAADGTDRILLVGNGSADTAVPGNQVVVPAQAILATPPGYTADQEIGRFAWWVGDEGVKARANLTDPLAPRPASSDGSAPAFTPTAAQEQLRLSAAQRLGVERETGLDEIATSLAQTPAGADARLSVARVIHGRQLPLINPGITAAEARARFHDVTTHSAGVLSDTRKGGLKGDLTYLFAPTTVSAFQSRFQTYLGTTPALSATYNPIVGDLNDDGVFNDAWANGPTWEQLWSFSHLNNAPAGTPAGVVNASGELVPRAQTPTQHGIAPVLLQARMFNGFNITQTAPNQNQVHILLRPAFVIANPYTKPLAATTYYVTVDFNSGSNFTVVGWWRNGVDGTGSPVSAVTFRGSRNLSACYTRMTFKLISPVMQPGAALIFSLKNAAGTFPAAPAATEYEMDSDWDPNASIDMLLSTYYSITDAEVATGVGSRIGDASVANGGGTMRFNLWDENKKLIQRIEPIGYGPTQYNKITTTGTTWCGGFELCRPGPGDAAADNQIKGINLRSVLSHSRFTVTGAATFSPGAGYLLSMRTRPEYYAGRMVIDTSNLSSGITPVYWGKRTFGDGAYQDTVNADQYKTAVFYDVPNADAPLVSIGQLQHFNAAGHLDTFNITFGAAPATDPANNLKTLVVGTGYAVGNSRASSFIARDKTNNNDTYDAPYLLNRALFDTYFFSALPQTGAFDFATDVASNPRLRPFRSALASNAIASYRTDARSAAANLLNLGAFNINSTSAEAWKALFSSLNQIPYPGTTTSLTGAFARSLHQAGGYTGAADGVSANAWTGYRNLTNVPSTGDIDKLAAQMVVAVKARGPFRSLSDFVNRRIATGATGLQGALDEAIEKAGLNTVTTAPYKDLPTRASAQLIDSTNGEIQSAGAPGWLGQGDLLQALAPGLAARSDTFIIRTYGDVRNPATGGTQPDSRAWLEAVVQRLPDYVVPKNGATGNAPDETPAAGSDNEKYGRRFQVVSFRWLGADEI